MEMPYSVPQYLGSNQEDVSSSWYELPGALSAHWADAGLGQGQ